jgi:hypothetical protein
MNTKAYLIVVLILIWGVVLLNGMGVNPWV